MPGRMPLRRARRVAAITRAAAEPCQVDITLEAAFKGFYQSPDSPLIRWLAEQGETTPDVVTYGSNALQYTDLGAEIVVFGPGSIDQAHQAVEWIDIDEVDKAARLYRRLLRS
jgi:acetylornithine deacetylase